MRLLRDDFLVVESQFGELDTQSQIVGYLNDPEYTPRGKIHPLFLTGGILSILGLPFLLVAASQMRGFRGINNTTERGD